MTDPYREWLAATGADRKVLRVVVPGRPTSWARARKFGKRHFNESATDDMEAAVAGAAMAAMSAQGFDPIPKGRQAAVRIYIATDTRGGDVDRYENVVLDGLTKGGVWSDDRQCMGRGCIDRVDYLTKAHGITPETAELVVEVWDNGAKGD